MSPFLCILKVTYPTLPTCTMLRPACIVSSQGWKQLLTDQYIQCNNQCCNGCKLPSFVCGSWVNLPPLQIPQELWGHGVKPGSKPYQELVILDNNEELWQGQWYQFPCPTEQIINSNMMIKVCVVEADSHPPLIRSQCHLSDTSWYSHLNFRGN